MTALAFSIAELISKSWRRELEVVERVHYLRYVPLTIAGEEVESCARMLFF